MNAEGPFCRRTLCQSATTLIACGFLLRRLGTDHPRSAQPLARSDRGRRAVQAEGRGYCRKDRYYETLEQSSQGWHGGKHDPWPYLNYLLSILKAAYREFEDRLGQIKTPRGEKSEVVVNAIKRAAGDFSVADLQRECPGVSVDMIRHVLKGLRRTGDVECLGRGRSARWRWRAPRTG